MEKYFDDGYEINGQTFLVAIFPRKIMAVALSNYLHAKKRVFAFWTTLLNVTFLPDIQ